MPGIGLISNPQSRANLRDPSKARKLGYLIGSHGTAEATRSLDDLYRVCEEFKKERIEILGISGGDGTMNTIANSLGIKGEAPRLLFELVDKHRRGLGAELQIFEQEVLQIGDKYGFIFGNGIIYNFLHEYYATGKPSPSTATKLIAAAAASTMISGDLARRIYRRFHARVVADGDTWACEDFITVAAAVVEQIGLGFKPFYRCNEQPGRFAVLGIHTNAFGFVSDLPRILAGRPMRRDKVIDQVASEIVFTSLESDKLEYIIDGDTYVGDETLTLKTGPRLRFVRLTGEATDEVAVPSQV